MNVNDCSFTSNSATAGAILTKATGTSTVTDSTFTNNKAYGGGGAIYNDAIDAENDAGSLNVSNSIFAGNSAGQGGAISSTGNDINSSSSDKFGSLTINNSVFNDNSLVSTNNIQSDGGAICSNTEPCTVTNSVFTGNAADYQGGAIYAGPLGILTVTKNNFSDNKATDDGGAILDDGIKLNVNNCIFTSNSASAAGAIYNTGTSTVTGSTFTSNKATYGGAAYNFGNLIVTDSTFNINSAYSLGGAIVNVGTAVVKFNRIVGNTAKTYGNAIYNENGKVNATLNWWGSNSLSNLSKQISDNNNGAVLLYNPWIVLTITASPTTVSVGGTSTITADFLHDSNGVYHNPASVVPYTGTANFKTTKGTIKNVNYVNGKAMSKLTNLTTPGVANISCVGQTSVTTVTVKGVQIVVTKINPGNGAINVPINEKITVTFSDPNGLSLKEGSGYSSISVKNSNGFKPLIRTSFIGKTLTITRIGNYAPGNEFIITIPANAIVDTSGNGLATAYTSSFTTV